MLINIEPGREVITKIEGQAHIVISLDADGKPLMKAFFMGRHDCTYSQRDDARLFERELPKLLAELRLQIELGRPLTMDESATMKKQTQASSGSASIE